MKSENGMSNKIFSLNALNWKTSNLKKLLVALSMILIISCSPKKRTIQSYQNSSLIKISSKKDLYNYLKINKIDTVFLWFESPDKKCNGSVLFDTSQFDSLIYSGKRLILKDRNKHNFNIVSDSFDLFSANRNEVLKFENIDSIYPYIYIGKLDHNCTIALNFNDVDYLIDFIKNEPIIIPFAINKDNFFGFWVHIGINSFSYNFKCIESKQ